MLLLYFVLTKLSGKKKKKKRKSFGSVSLCVTYGCRLWQLQTEENMF